MTSNNPPSVHEAAILLAQPHARIFDGFFYCNADGDLCGTCPARRFCKPNLLMPSNLITKAKLAYPELFI